MPSKVVSSIAAVGLAAGLSACGNTHVVGAISVPDVQSQNLISATAPGEIEAVTFSAKSHCKGSGRPSPTQVVKQFGSTSSVSSVKDFYTELAAQGQWYHRTDTAGSGEQTLNYSMERGEQYWELHITLPASTSGEYEVELDAYNASAHC